MDNERDEGWARLKANDHVARKLLVVFGMAVATVLTVLAVFASNPD